MLHSLLCSKYNLLWVFNFKIILWWSDCQSWCWNMNSSSIFCSAHPKGLGISGIREEKSKSATHSTHSTFSSNPSAIQVGMKSGIQFTPAARRSSAHIPQSAQNYKSILTFNRSWRISTTPNITKFFWSFSNLYSNLLWSFWVVSLRKIKIWIWGKKVQFITESCVFKAETPANFPF